MKQKSVVGRWPLAVGRWPFCAMLIAGGVLMLAPQARAAHWEMSFTADGINKPGWSEFGLEDGDGSDLPEQSTWSELMERTPDPQTGRFSARNGQVDFSVGAADMTAPSGNPKSIYRAMPISVDGSITVHLKWVQDPEDTTSVPVPKMVFLRIWGYVSVEGQTPNGQITIESKFGAIAGTPLTSNFFEDGFVIKDSFVNVNEANSLTVPLAIHEGESEKEYTFSLNGKVEGKAIEQSPSSYPWILIAQVNADFHAKPAEIGVGISSSIETSWKKWTGAASDLPDAYKARDENGALTDAPNGKAVLVSSDATDPSENVWKLACLRGDDGKMSVESAATWMAPIPELQPDGTMGNAEGTGEWYGSAVFSENHEGLSEPVTHNWSLSGGTATGHAQTELDNTTASNVNLDLSAGYSTIDDLGNQYDGLTGVSLGGPSLATNSSTINLDLQGDDGTIVSDDYTVNWHLPYENWFRYADDDTLWDSPPLDIDNPGVAYNGGGINCRWDYEKAQWGELYGAGGAAVIGVTAAAASNPVWLSFWAVAGIAASEVGEMDSKSGIANFSDGWTNSRSTFDPPKSDGVAASRYQMVPSLNLRYTLSYLAGEAYGSNGYSGQVRRATRKFADEIEWSGDFERISGEE